MNGIWKIVLLGAVLAILMLFALGLENDPRNIPSPLVNRPASDFSAPALEGGQPVKLSAYRGKWVLVNFWGSWCISCIAEHPYLMELSAKVKSRTDFVMLGVDFRDTPEAARAFLAQHGNPGYPHVQDPDQKIAIDWGVYGAPESYLVDPTGTIRMKHTGPLFSGWFELRALPLMEGAKP